jgi:glutathione synthase/RimK-type ligase-like ATP-grasp enzyme
LDSFTIIGNPGHRRVEMFQRALLAQGHAAADVIAWRELAEPGAAARLLADVRGIVRIDSGGEDDEVERALIRRGEAAARAERRPALSAGELDQIPRELGRILAPRQHYLGMCAVLDEIALAVTSDMRVLQPPAAIAQLFDKSACSTRWQALGIAMPEALHDVADPDELRARMDAAGWTTVFVKITSGSSAAGLAIFERQRTREHMITTVEDTGDARYNTRRLQRMTDRRRIDRVLRFLLAEGAIVERAIPKARLEGRHVDLRVLVIDGEPAFTVARTSAHPITNLHLGGQRGDLGAMRALVPEQVWTRAMTDCVAVQRATGAFHVGVDVMVEANLAGHRVLEGNAFGDLLPNLERDGLDVYGWQIRRLGSAG